MANVIAANWNAGIFPVATVSTASSDHIRIAVSPIRVAVRGVMKFVIASQRVGAARRPMTGSAKIPWGVDSDQV